LKPGRPDLSWGGERCDAFRLAGRLKLRVDRRLFAAIAPKMPLDNIETHARDAPISAVSLKTESRFKPEKYGLSQFCRWRCRTRLPAIKSASPGGIVIP
jgi:hypothetical protein